MELADLTTKAMAALNQAQSLGFGNIPQYADLMNVMASANPLPAAMKYRTRILKAEVKRLQLAEAARLVEEARREAERIAQEEAERLNVSPEIRSWRANAQRRIELARGLGISGPVLDNAINIIAPGSPATWEQIRYRVVALNKEIKKVQRALGIVPPARTNAAATPATGTSAAAAAITTPGLSAAQASAIITSRTSERELMDILSRRLEHNRAEGFDGDIMDWWQEFTQGDNRLQGRIHREEIMRGIARMDEFETSLRNNSWGTVAKRNFKGKPTPLPPMPKGYYTLDANAKKRLERAGWSDAGYLDPDKYNEAMGGFNLEQFSKEADDLFKKYGIKINSRQVSAYGNKAVFTIDGRHGSEQFYLKRTVTYKTNGDKTIEHDYLTVPKKLQGQNFTKELFSSLYTQYKSSNIREITVHANITVGSYAWGRYGFMANVTRNGSPQRDLLISMVESYKLNKKTRNIPAVGNKPAVPSKPINNADMDRIIAYINSTPKGQPVDMHQVSSMSGAYDLLYSQHWYGFIDLKDPHRRGIFEDYLGKRK